MIGGFVVLVVVSAIAGDTESGDDSSSNDSADETPTVETVTEAAEPATQAPPAPEEPDPTAGQEEALESAQSYLDLGGFSRTALIQQLSSSAGEGFTRAEAQYAVNQVYGN